MARPDPYENLTTEELRLLEERARRYAAATKAEALETFEAIRFRRGALEFAIALLDLREIRPLRSMCPIPGASKVVPGVLHHRGEILSVHDLAAFLGTERDTADAAFALVVEASGRTLALLADELVDVVAVAPSRLAPMPVTLGDRAGCFAGLVDEMAVIRTVGLLETPDFANAF